MNILRTLVQSRLLKIEVYCWWSLLIQLNRQVHALLSKIINQTNVTTNFKFNFFKIFLLMSSDLWDSVLAYLV